MQPPQKAPLVFQGTCGPIAAWVRTHRWFQWFSCVMSGHSPFISLILWTDHWVTGPKAVRPPWGEGDEDGFLEELQVVGWMYWSQCKKETLTINVADWSWHPQSLSKASQKLAPYPQVRIGQNVAMEINQNMTPILNYIGNCVWIRKIEENTISNRDENKLYCTYQC